MNPIPLAVTNIRRRPLRNWLTILGVVIGIAAIVGLINVGQGLQKSINEVVETSGTQRLYVQGRTPGGPGSSADLTNTDLKVVQSFSEFSLVSAWVYKNQPVEYGSERLAIQVGALENMEENFLAFGVDVESGRFLTERDSKAAVIGYKVDELFDKEIILGTQLEINGEKYRVVGVAETFGNPGDDTVIYIPFESAQTLFGLDERISLITAEVKQGLDVKKVAEKLENKLEDSRGDDSLEVSTQEQLLETFGTILDIVNLIVTGIAGISLVVGAVGIMNSMYTSVLERTKEIGIMKSIGATNKQILSIFISEAALIGLIGGVVGTALGFGIGKAVESVSAAAGVSFIKVDPTIDLLLFGIVFGIVFGAIAGILPARNASMLQPVDSLRYD